MTNENKVLTPGKETEAENGMIEVQDFDWIDYFERINEKVSDKKFFSSAPDSAFQHVEASLDSGVKEGFVVEYQWDEENNFYWLAIVENVFGPLLKLSYVGENKQTGEIWHDLSKKRLFPLGWCQLNKFELQPPEQIRNVCKEWESLALKYLEDISYDTISMHHIDGEGVTPLDRLRPGMILELQDFEHPYHFWPMVIKANRGCLLTLEYLYFEGHLETLFYLSTKLHPKGYAAKNEKASYVMPAKLKVLDLKPDAPLPIGSDGQLDIDQVEGPGVPGDLMNVRIPDKHKFEAGYHLEMIHPVTSAALERFFVDSVVDEHYFIVQSINDAKLRRVTSLLDTSIFPCGTSKSLKSVSCTINDANTRGKVVQKRNFPDFDSAEELGFVDRQKLEVFYQEKFRTATILETRNHLMVLEVDSDSTDGKQRILKSAHSMDIFPLGWCSTNSIISVIPKSFFPDDHFKAMEEAVDDQSEAVADEAMPEAKAEPETVLPKQGEPAVSSWCIKVYFNYKCYSASFLSKARLACLPKAIGPGPVNLVVRTVLNHLIGSSFKSGSVLKRLELKEGGSVRPFFVVEEFKGKSRVLNLKANIEIPTRTDQVDTYLTEVCKKVGACPHLVSTRLFEDICPEDCQSKPKSEFDQQPKLPTAQQPPKPRLNVGRKRKNPESVLLEKASGVNSSTPSDESDAMTPSTSRANSPTPESRNKRGRLLREAKLNHMYSSRSYYNGNGSGTGRGGKRNGATTISPNLKKGLERPLRRGPGRRPAEPIVKPRQVVSDVDEGDDDDDDDDEDESSDEMDSDSDSGQTSGKLPPPIRPIRLRSNPEWWSPMDTARFLAQTTDCRHLAHLMIEEAVDGQAFLLLTYPTIRDHWQLQTSTAIRLCQHIESVRLAHILQF